MAKQNRRRPSSASSTPRPRRIAGRSGPAPEPSAPDELDEDLGQTSAPEPERAAEPETVAGAEPESGAGADPGTEPEPEGDAEQLGSAAWGGFVESARTTRILLVVVLALALAALAGGVFLWVHDDAGSSIAADDGSVIEADDETPVRITGKDAQVAVAAAAQAAYTIVATSWEDYDAQVDESAELMTPAFAEEYRQTAADVEDAILKAKTEVQVSVVAQGVVRADQGQVQALIFLNMFTTKNGKEPVFTPYRVLVTVVNTDQGWLVSDLDTK